MRTILAFALLLGLTGCSTDPSHVAANPANFAVPSFDDLTLGDPIEQEALTIIPVSTKKLDQSFDDYVTLAEAKENKWIEIIEIPGEEQVETLKVHYSGPRPMILFAGELLLGGKQDRVVAKDTIIKPEETVDVMVFCVEPGRWDGMSMHFDAQDAQVPLEVKEMAIEGDQQEVWNKVGGYNEAYSAVAGVPIDGTSLRGGFEAATNTKEFSDALAKAMKALEGREDVVGLVIVLGGKLHSFEYFGSPRLFQGSAESIVRGALASATVQKGKGGTPPMKDVADFVSRSLKGTSEAKLAENDSWTYFRSTRDAIVGGVTNQPGASPEDAKIVHGTFYDKKN